MYTIVSNVQPMLLIVKQICFCSVGKLVPFVENAVATGSALTIIAISFERYYAICLPLKAQYVCTTRLTAKVIIAIWLVSLGVCSPFLQIVVYKDSHFLDGTPIKVCRTYITDVWQHIYIMMLMVMFFVMPIFILSLVYVLVGRRLFVERVLADIKSSHMSSSILRSRRQVVLMLFVVVVLFFTCLMPIKVTQTWLMFSSSEDKMRLGFEAYLNLVYFTRVMFYLNSTVNPICYNVISTKFRGAFQRALYICGRHHAGRRLIVSTVGFDSRRSLSLRKKWSVESDSRSMTSRRDPERQFSRSTSNEYVPTFIIQQGDEEYCRCATFDV